MTLVDTALILRYPALINADIAVQRRVLLRHFPDYDVDALLAPASEKDARA